MRSKESEDRLDVDPISGKMCALLVREIDNLPPGSSECFFPYLIRRGGLRQGDPA